MSEGDPSSARGGMIGSRVDSRVGINREGSFRNSSGLPRYKRTLARNCQLIIFGDPDQVEINIPPSFTDFLNQGLKYKRRKNKSLEQISGSGSVPGHDAGTLHPLA